MSSINLAQPVECVWYRISSTNQRQTAGVFGKTFHSVFWETFSICHWRC